MEQTQAWDMDGSQALLLTAITRFALLAHVLLLHPKTQVSSSMGSDTSWGVTRSERCGQHVEGTITDEAGSGGSATTGDCFKGLVGFNQDRYSYVQLHTCSSHPG